MGRARRQFPAGAATKLRLSEDRRACKVRAMCDVLGAAAPRDPPGRRGTPRAMRRAHTMIVLSGIAHSLYIFISLFCRMILSKKSATFVQITLSGSRGEPRPRRTAHASSRHPGTNAAAVSGARHGQPACGLHRLRANRRRVAPGDQATKAAARRSTIPTAAATPPPPITARFPPRRR